MKTFSFSFVSVGSLWLASMVTLPSQTCVPPPPGLFAWWQGESNTVDSAGANQATLLNGAGFAPAEVGAGFALNGGTEYIALPPNLFPYPASGTGNAPFSLELWFSTWMGGVILGQQPTIPFTAPQTYVPALYVGTDGRLYAAMFWNNAVQLVSAAAVNDDHFHHAAVTYDGTTEVLYLDGAAVASTNFTQQAYGSGSYQYQLGTGFTGGWPAANGGWYSFSGLIDEVSVYNRALTAGEVAAVFSAGNQGKCAGTLLFHRYSFNEAAGSSVAADSAGGADGILLYAGSPADGSGFTGTGGLSLNGANGYVSLPAGLISSLSSVSFEVWVTWGGPSGSAFQRIFDFGANASGNGTNYMALIAQLDSPQVPAFAETTLYPFGPQVDTNAITLNGAAPLPLGQETYVAVTYDPIGGACQFFVNGVLVNSIARPLNPMNKFADYNNWLGRSQWTDNLFFKGQYDEFRVWQGILSQQQIANHFAAGPNQSLPVFRPALSIARSGGNVLLAWATNSTAAFRLQSVPSLSSTNWLLVTNAVVATNAAYQVTLPATGAAAFYRLKR